MSTDPRFKNDGSIKTGILKVEFEEYVYPEQLFYDSVYSKVLNYLLKESIMKEFSIPVESNCGDDILDLSMLSYDSSYESISGFMDFLVYEGIPFSAEWCEFQTFTKFGSFTENGLCINILML